MHIKFLFAAVCVGLLLALLLLLLVVIAVIRVRTKRSTSLHEASHAVSAWCSPVARPVSVQAGFGTGICSVAYDLPHEMDSEYYMWVAVIFMAGVAGESMGGYGTWIFSYESDVSMACAHARYSLRDADPRLLAALTNVSPEDELAVTLLCAQNCVHVPEGDTLKALALAYSIAIDVVGLNWNKTTKVAEKLYHRGYLNERELTSILGTAPAPMPIFS